MSTQVLSRAELELGLPDILLSPRDKGVLKMIVQRPAVDERRTIHEGILSLEDGLVGDNWKSRRNAHADMQLTLMNARVAALVARELSRWPLAGDQLYVDLDLSWENLPVGTLLRAGSAVVAVTEIPHLGCSKFRARFGRDARDFVNSEVGCKLNLRGINARVVEGGEIEVGGNVTVEQRGAA
jgi:MOSC domain-containing protein YiiM